MLRLVKVAPTARNPTTCHSIEYFLAISSRTLAYSYLVNLFCIRYYDQTNSHDIDEFVRNNPPNEFGQRRLFNLSDDGSDEDNNPAKLDGNTSVH